MRHLRRSKHTQTMAKKKTQYNCVYFCRFSDSVYEAAEGREGEDLLGQSEPGRHLAPRQREHLEWP